MTLREGSDVTVFSSGPHTARALEAADMLAGEGIDVHLVHVPTIKPLDNDEVVAAAKKTGLVVTTEEGTIVGGLGGAIAEILSQKAPMPMKLHGIDDIFGESGPDGALLEKYGLSPHHIADSRPRARRRQQVTRHSSVFNRRWHEPPAVVCAQDRAWNRCSRCSTNRRWPKQALKVSLSRTISMGPAATTVPFAISRMWPKPGGISSTW